MPRSCTHAVGDTTKNERFRVYGIFEREKQFDDISKMGGNMKFKYRNREFWCRGYYVDTAGKNTKKIAEYIQNQLKEDEGYTRKRKATRFTGGFLLKKFYSIYA